VPGWHTIIRGLAPQAGGFRRRSNKPSSVGLSAWLIVVVERLPCVLQVVACHLQSRIIPQYVPGLQPRVGVCCQSRAIYYQQTRRAGRIARGAILKRRLGLGPKTASWPMPSLRFNPAGFAPPPVTNARLHETRTISLLDWLTTDRPRGERSCLVTTFKTVPVLRKLQKS